MTVPGQDVGLLLRKALLLLHQDMPPDVERLGLASVAYSTLAILSRSSEIRLYRLTELLGIRPANCVALINELEQRGWVRRRKVPDRGRAVALSLTEQGNEILSRAEQEIGARPDPLRDRLGTQDAERLLQLLRRLVEPQTSIGKPT